MTVIVHTYYIDSKCNNMYHTSFIVFKNKKNINSGLIRALNFN